MDSDNDSYHSENEFYYPDEENVLQENKNIVITSNDTSADEQMSTIQDFIEAQRPENAAEGRTHDLWHSFSQYGPPGRQITYISSHVIVNRSPSL